jgi:hypothetical protein
MPLSQEQHDYEALLGRFHVVVSAGKRALEEMMQIPRDVHKQYARVEEIGRELQTKAEEMWKANQATIVHAASQGEFERLVSEFIEWAKALKDHQDAPVIKFDWASIGGAADFETSVDRFREVEAAAKEAVEKMIDTASGKRYDTAKAIRREFDARAEGIRSLTRVTNPGPEHKARLERLVSDFIEWVKDLKDDQGVPVLDWAAIELAWQNLANDDGGAAGTSFATTSLGTASVPGSTAPGSENSTGGSEGSAPDGSTIGDSTIGDASTAVSVL